MQKTVFGAINCRNIAKKIKVGPALKLLFILNGTIFMTTPRRSIYEPPVIIYELLLKGNCV